MDTCDRVGNVKTPRLYETPQVALKKAITATPELFLEVLITAQKKVLFPVMKVTEVDIHPNAKK